MTFFGLYPTGMGSGSQVLADPDLRMLDTYDQTLVQALSSRK
jgi:hypothetical protein